jgi:hypothetical protein
VPLEDADPTVAVKLDEGAASVGRNRGGAEHVRELLPEDLQRLLSAAQAHIVVRVLPIQKRQQQDAEREVHGNG